MMRVKVKVKVKGKGTVKVKVALKVQLSKICFFEKPVFLDTSEKAFSNIFLEFNLLPFFIRKPKNLS